MARLPSERYLIQQSGGEVILFGDGTEREIVRFDPTDMNATAQAQKTIYDSELSPEDKCFAHLWSGYFYAHARVDWGEPDDGIAPDASRFRGGEPVVMNGLGPGAMFQMQWSGELVTVVVDSLEPAGGGRVNFRAHVITDAEAETITPEPDLPGM